VPNRPSDWHLLRLADLSAVALAKVEVSPSTPLKHETGLR
jgi:hypothetical protein